MSFGACGFKSRPRHFPYIAQAVLRSTGDDQMMRFSVVLILLASGCLPLAKGQEVAVETLLLQGRYEESLENANSGESTGQLTRAHCLVALGRRDEALELLRLAPASGQLDGTPVLAQLLLDRGDLDGAEKTLKALGKSRAASPHAQFLKAEIFRSTGRIEEAGRLYASQSEIDPDSLPVREAFWIGRAIAMHGRWSRDAQVFDRLVNVFWPRLLKRNEHFWPAHLEMGRLFLEKFNTADAQRELNAALAINPRAAEVHVELAQLALVQFNFDRVLAEAARARELNPELASAHRVQADLAFANLEPEKAEEPLELARELNPSDELTLGRVLAFYLRQDGFESDNDAESRAGKLIAKVTKRNPKCGRFFESVADGFDALRYYPLAERYYQKAIETLPQLVAARGKLGMVQMRLGNETDARETLEESFRVDPFNVRVKNTLEVLDLLDTYQVIETDHFVLRFDRGQDGLLAEYASRYLEAEVYPDIVKVLGYEPKDKTLLEIFSRAKRNSGHSWFSARMVGLPFIGTVGACAGKMFALTSPADGQQYNWARVLRHEFVHVVNLQQTSFLIPHWFTEAIAVRNEGGKYPAEWEQILAKYVAEDQLFDLSNINHGFVRPDNQERWTLAYFQAYLYADFIVQKSGEGAIKQMLDGYADGKTTAEVIDHVANQSLDEFEKSYRGFLQDRVKDSAPLVSGASEQQSLRELEAAVEVKPNDAAAHARLAAALLKQGRTRDARKRAEVSIKHDEANPVARYVLARILFSVGDDDEAWKQIEAGLNEEGPDRTLLALAAGLKLKAREFEDAANLYELGRQRFPHDFAWTRGLARVRLAQGDDRELAKVLAEVAERDADKTALARKLTQLALRRKDFVEAERWASRVLHIEVMNPLAHAELARAFAGQQKFDEAIREYETALKLSPGESSWEQQLAKLKERNNQ